MNVLITGATGFIGKHVLESLITQHNVWCTRRNSSAVESIEALKCQWVFVDEEINLIYQKLMEIKPDIVIHIAGVFLGEHNSENIQDLIYSNIEFPAILFDAAYEAGCRQFINTGTCWQNYNGEKYNPVNLYAATKEAVENILQYYVKAKKCKAVTLKIFDSYGPNDRRRKVLNIVSKLRENETLDMSGGEQKMYLCYIEDIVSAYEHAIIVLQSMADKEYKTYSVRDVEAYTLKEIIGMYLELSKKNIKINWGKRKYREREIMDPTDWGEILPGWRPKHSLEQGMYKYINKEQM